jgi:hypothetical protein
VGLARGSLWPRQLDSHGGWSKDTGGLKQFKDASNEERPAPSQRGSHTHRAHPSPAEVVRALLGGSCLGRERVGCRDLAAAGIARALDHIRQALALALRGLGLNRGRGKREARVGCRVQ